MFNSYEISEKMKNKLHIKATYSLKDVHYNPCYSVHRISVENFKDEEFVFDIDDTALQHGIESMGMNTVFKMIEDEINDELKGAELDSLVEYYFKKGMHMADINKKLMTGGLNHER